MMSRAVTLSFALVALASAGCGSNSTTLPSLTTGSIFSSGQQAPPQPKPVTAVDRAIHVGAISARATKCGYNFDPAKLRQDYLNYETSAGAATAEIARATDAYDRTGRLLLQAVAKNENYCSFEQTHQIKADLSKVLAGDFSPPVRIRKESVGWLDSGLEGREVMNREAIFDPNSQQQKTKRVMDDDLQ